MIALLWLACTSVDDTTAPCERVAVHADADGDGFGAPAVLAERCAAAAGETTDASDCDDARSAVHPGAAEACNVLDDDCDGATDRDAIDAPDWFPDVDRDGHGDPSGGVAACAAPLGMIADHGDCDDRDAAVHPGADEVCDGLDDDCDALVDDEDDGLTGAPAWFRDADGDGWGAGPGIAACVGVGVTLDGDCDDANDTIHPFADEVCGGADDDCDALIDDVDPDLVDAPTRYLDGDGDGWAGTPTRTCTTAGSDVGGDCDDTDSAINPGAGEWCDGVDDDCDGLVDDLDPDVEAEDAWYADRDGDGFGDVFSGLTACAAPVGYIAEKSDCDDTDAAVSPGATEICGDDTDEDCDGDLDACPFTGIDVDLTADADGAFAGVSRSDDAGRAVAAAGDIDGDGLSDVLVGASANDLGGASAGAAYLVLGGHDGAFDLSAADGVLLGDTGVRAGASVAGVGDLDGDGLDDLLVGAPRDGTVGKNGGSAALFLGSGALGTVAWTDAALIISGATGDGLGAKVGGAGDLDGDGVPDLLVSAPAIGESYVFSGAAASGALTAADADVVFVAETSWWDLGESLDGGGDVDGDGAPDVLLGATDAGYGSVFLVLGGGLSGALAIPTDADLVIEGSDSGDSAATSVSSGGDHDGDGYADILVGAIGADTAPAPLGREPRGIAYLLSGAALPADIDDAHTLLQGDDYHDYAGYSVDFVPDIDGDGDDEVAVSAIGADVGGTRGAVYVLFGPVDPGTFNLGVADVRLYGEEAANTGQSIAGLRDADGDGRGDLLIGAPGTGESGGAYLIYSSGW